MRAVLLGSTGLLGRDLAARKPGSLELLCLPRSSDLTQPSSLTRPLLEFHPDIIINAAAYNAVDRAESDADTARSVNAEGPAVLAGLAQEMKAVLVHISTDYVFPDAGAQPFIESDEPRPVSVYAQTKLEGEHAARDCDKHYVLRTSALYGWGRANHATRLLAAIESGEKLRLARDLFGSPTYTGDLAEWIYALLEKAPPYGLYHLCHTGSCSRADFARALCESVQAKLPYPFEEVTLSDLNLPAPRPSRHFLSMEKWMFKVAPLKTWQEGLATFLQDRPVDK